MKDFLSATGTLAVDVGIGWISRYEAGALAPGDVVRSDIDAGSAQRVSLNGEYLCEGSVVVARGGFFARIEGLEPEALPPAPPERGDEATELLPFAIRLASIEVALSALSGIGRHSYIDLDKALGADDAEDAVLMVAGIPLAAGKAAVIDESFGIRITRRIAEKFEEREIRTTGNLLFPGYAAERIKDYDFRRPDCFKKRGILKARDIHKEFLRALQARLPQAAKYSLESVDQLSYGEWTGAQPASGKAYALLGAEPPREREPRGGSLPARLFVGPASSRVDPGVEKALREYAERRAEPSGGRPIVVSLGGAASSLLEEDPGLAIVASCLRNGWKRVADFRIGQGVKLMERAPGDEAAFPGDMILFVRLESAEGGSVELVYPIRSLEPCFTALNA